MDEKACIKGKVSKGLSNEAAKKKCAEETKNTLSPSIKDLKEVHVEEPMVKAWDFDPDSILKSTRKVTGTFHVPKVDKDREIITKAAMTDAIPDFMHLPILHDFHKERVLGLVTKVWEEADAFHFEALFKATHDVDDAWDKVSKGQYDHVSIYGSRLQGSASCGLDPSQRAVPCISNKIRLDSISACDDAARNDMSSLKLAKGFVIESEDGEVTFMKAEVPAYLKDNTNPRTKKENPYKDFRHVQSKMANREQGHGGSVWKSDEEEKAETSGKLFGEDGMAGWSEKHKQKRKADDKIKTGNPNHPSWMSGIEEKAETSGGLIHGTYDGVHNSEAKKKGGNMRVREVDEDDDRYKEDEKEKKAVKKGDDEEEEKASQNDPQQKQEQSVVVKGDYDINGMFNRILDVLHKLVNSDKKVHSEIDKAEERIPLKKEEEKEKVRFTKVSQAKEVKKGSELDWMKDKEDTQAKQRKEGVPSKERESFSQTNRFVNKCTSCTKKDEEETKAWTRAGRSQVASRDQTDSNSPFGGPKTGNAPGNQAVSDRMNHRDSVREHQNARGNFAKSGDNMAEEVKEEIVKAAPKEEPKVETDEDFVQNIVKANLETQTKSLQEFMKAQTDEIKKAVEKLTAMEDRIKKIEEQPIQKAAVVISEQLKPMEGYGSLNYKAIQRG